MLDRFCVMMFFIRLFNELLEINGSFKKLGIMI